MSPLYDNMTKKEVIEEFARILAQIIRRRLAQQELEKEKNKSNSTKKKENNSSDVKPED